MRIEGIGVISKNKALSILTKEGCEAVKAGEITIEELGEMYKLFQSVAAGVASGPSYQATMI